MSWLIATAGRTAFRPHCPGELFLPGEGSYAGHAYCLAPAAFGTPADTDLLTVYLARYLAIPDLDYDQTSALGALLHLEATHGTDHAAPFLTPAGPWNHWAREQPRRGERNSTERQETMAR